MMKMVIMIIIITRMELTSSEVYFFFFSSFVEVIFSGSEVVDGARCLIGLDIGKSIFQ